VKLILASGSPRRAEVLQRAGFVLESLETRVEETLAPRESPEAYVERLARSKARAAADDLLDTAETTFIIGADTTVIASGEMLEKPVDAKDARRMLRLLSGKAHEVLTGVSVLVLPEGQSANFVERTLVHFLPLSDGEIEEYVAAGEPFGKAGAYGIQGIGGRFVERVEGCYFNVMGMPLARVWMTLRSLGWKDAAL
jgi:septum formation protein